MLWANVITFRTSGSNHANELARMAITLYKSVIRLDSSTHVLHVVGFSHANGCDKRIGHTFGTRQIKLNMMAKWCQQQGEKRIKTLKTRKRPFDSEIATVNRLMSTQQNQMQTIPTHHTFQSMVTAHNEVVMSRAQRDTNDEYEKGRSRRENGSKPSSERYLRVSCV